MTAAEQREWYRLKADEIAERKAELIGNRRRKFYRNSRLVSERLIERRKELAMQSAARRLQRIFL